jgi:hypothetical protein
MSLTLLTMDYETNVTVDGEPFYIDSDVMYFPVERVLVIGSICKWYDNLSRTGLNEDTPYKIEDLQYRAYNMNDQYQSFRAMDALYDHGVITGKEKVRSAIRRELKI